jgi:hypothetical protein
LSWLYRRTLAPKIFSSTPILGFGFIKILLSSEPVRAAHYTAIFCSGAFDSTDTISV